MTLPRPVEVLHDGVWCRGWLEAYRQDTGGWHGYVRYAVAPGRRYLQWRDAAELRRAVEGLPG